MLRYLALGFVFVLLWAARPEAAPAPVAGVVDLRPAERAAWSPLNLGVGLSSLLGGWSYWYDDRVIEIQTVPATASLSLYYIRSSFQKKFQRAETPAQVLLPPRVDMTARDSVRFHAAADGYLSQDVGFDARGVPEKVMIELRALPNALAFAGLTHFAGRTTLVLRTVEEAELRMSKSASGTVFQIALSKTALRPEAAATLSGGRLVKVQPTQLGEDAILRAETYAGDVEVRSRKAFDPISGQHVYAFDIVGAGERAPSDAEIRTQLERVRFEASDPCALKIAAVLRARLDSTALAAAFRPTGVLVDLFRREAMLRLGRMRAGTVSTEQGESYRTGSPLELELALQSASEVRGYLALLAALAQTESDPELALRSLVAPELSATDFAPAFAEVAAAQRGCRG